MEVPRWKLDIELKRVQAEAAATAAIQGNQPRGWYERISKT